MTPARLLAVLAWLWLAGAASAQSLTGATPALESWETLAERAETATENGVASSFALTRLRDELFSWRDAFLGDQQANAGRIATLRGQIDALGTPPEGEEEPAAIASRRAALEEELARLRVPAILAQEAYARADGLITEIDALVRARETERLTERGTSLLNPSAWPDGLAALTGGLATFATTIVGRLEAEAGSGALLRNLPLGLVYFAVAFLLLTKGRVLVGHAHDRMRQSRARLRAAWAFALSLGQIALPTIGLFALILGLTQFRLLDLPGVDLIGTLFLAGMTVIVARWLNGQLFPAGEDDPGPLRYDSETRSKIRRLGISAAVGLAVALMLDEIVALSEPTDLERAVALAPMLLILSWLVYRLGHALRQPPMDANLPTSSGGRVRAAIGQLVMFVAIASPVLAVLGYHTASEAFFVPALLTLAILGVVVVLQRLVYDLYTPEQIEPDEEEPGPLLPVLIGFALLVLALPALALAWGARPAELFEIWARFREGLALGDVRISPVDLVWFLLVFGLGYLATRFVQSTLRKSVMPRTKLDLGGQNAIVAGVGYVGIFLAALVAITSAGIDLSNLAIVAGALSVGIGFGLQNIVQNFVSGIILLIERPIGEGDMIEVNGQMGYVRDISVRSTRIETFDRTDVIIPNADLVSGQVTNWTRGNAVGRLILPVGVAYGTDVAQVKAILLEVAEAHPMVLGDPPPQVLFITFGASSLDFELRVILRDVNWKLITASEMNETINTRFAEAGIEIPFAQRDLWLRNPEALRGPPQERDET